MASSFSNTIRILSKRSRNGYFSYFKIVQYIGHSFAVLSVISAILSTSFAVLTVTSPFYRDYLSPSLSSEAYKKISGTIKPPLIKSLFYFVSPKCSRYLLWTVALLTSKPSPLRVIAISSKVKPRLRSLTISSTGTSLRS